MLKKFTADVEYETLVKLPGYYTVNNQQVLIPIEFFQGDTESKEILDTFEQINAKDDADGELSE